MAEAGHLFLTEYKKDITPHFNWVMEDLFCRYGRNIPYYILEFDFPDYPSTADWHVPYQPWDMPNFPKLNWPEWMWPQLPDWPPFGQWPEWIITSNYQFNMDWNYKDPWKWELIGLLQDEADIPREQSENINNIIDDLYDAPIAEDTNVYAEIAGSVGATHYTWEVSKDGTEWHDTVAEAWDEHDTRDTTGGEDVSYDNGRYFRASVFSSSYPDYKAQATTQILCLLFDTSAISSGASTITLRLNVDAVNDGFETPTVQSYYIHEAFTTDHYDTPGTLINEGDISDTGVTSISLTSEAINFDGMTRIVLRVKQMLAGNRPDTIGKGSGITLHVDLCNIRFEY